ncbi:MAG: methionyl-tRNA formyltransferase [Oscillospiraceae bacterium]|jgi:methionyl-tRNA formyltransferase|nr:methionyl-tRNA formyltransferase [Oscillospiraceae bacterium]
MRIVFMGTPDFAVPPLKALINAGHNVAAVVTQPDRPAGRGGRVEAPPVKRAALDLGLNVVQPERLRRREHIESLRALDADAFVTAAYGQILSQRLLDIPRIGTINVHASLLPRYRGPAPVQWALINGERSTGVTTMMTDAGIDTGDTLLQRVEPILPDDTVDALLSRLSAIGAALLLETLARLERGDCPREPQNHAAATYFPTLTKEDGKIDWTKPAHDVLSRINGVTPWPGAYTSTPNGVIKIIRGRVASPDEYSIIAERHDDISPGMIIMSDPKRGLFIACEGNTTLEAVEVQPPSGKRMPAAAYLRGHPLTEGIRL